VLVPQSAVRSDEAGRFVWVVRDARVRRTTVTTGRQLGTSLPPIGTAMLVAQPAGI